jgi:hypothetical protein
LTVREWFGIALVAVQAALLMPLVVHAVRVRSGVGMSLSGEAIWAVAGVGWLVYAMWAQAPAVIVSGALAAVGSGLLTVLLWRAKARERRPALLLGAITLIGLASPAILYGEAGLSVALSVFGIVQFVPQFLESALHLRNGTATPGVSLTGAALRSLYTLGWAVYAGGWALWGLAGSRIDWPLVAWGLAGLIAFGAQALAAIHGETPAVSNASGR